MKDVKKIKTGVIGVGNMGRHHARVYSDISTLTAIADPDVVAGNLISKKYNIPYYKNYKLMIEKEKLDALSVVVPTSLHFKIVIECLHKGIPVLVEKPIAQSIEEANEMINVAEDKHIFFMVGHIERFNPAIKKLKQILDQKELGKIISLSSLRVGIAPPKANNADVVVDLGIHDIDVFNYLLNEYPKQTYTTKQKVFTHTNADTATIVLKYTSSTGMIQTNWITPIKKRKLYITGTEGFAELDYITQNLIIYGKSINTVSTGDFYEFISLLESTRKEVHLVKKEPLKEQLLFFLQQLNSKTILPPRYAVEALKIALL